MEISEKIKIYNEVKEIKEYFVNKFKQSLTDKIKHLHFPDKTRNKEIYESGFNEAKENILKLLT